MQSVQENDPLISVLRILAVIKLWICADLERNKDDLWKGKQEVQLQTQQKVMGVPSSAVEQRVSRPASPAGAAGVCASLESGEAELE